MSALDKQEGGNHYKAMKIQPVEFIHANNIPFIEGCIIKYASRWRDKGGVADLRKITHFAELLIELDTKHADIKVEEKPNQIISNDEIMHLASGHLKLRLDQGPDMIRFSRELIEKVNP